MILPTRASFHAPPSRRAISKGPLPRHEQHRVRRVGIEPVRGIQPTAQIALNRGKMDAPRGIMLHHEPHRAIAEMADAIKEQHAFAIGREIGHGGELRGIGVDGQAPEP